METEDPGLDQEEGGAAEDDANRAPGKFHLFANLFFLERDAYRV